MNSTTDAWADLNNWCATTKDAGRINFAETCNSDPRVRINLDNNGLPISVVQRIGSGPNAQMIEQAASNGLVLSKGHPIPFDQLLPEDRSSSAIIFKQTVSGVSFAETLNRTVMRGTVADIPAPPAGAKQTLVETLPGDQPLVRITVKKEEALMVEQWFIDGDNFWVFEQTPQRRSWRSAPSPSGN